MIKLNLNIESANDIAEHDFNALIKANLISTQINSKSTDIKKAVVIYPTALGVAKKTIQYVELIDNILEKGNYSTPLGTEGEIRKHNGEEYVRLNNAWSKVTLKKGNDEKADERWITVHGKHIKISGDGKIVAGNIGQKNSTSKSSSKESEDKEIAEMKKHPDFEKHFKGMSDDALRHFVKEKNKGKKTPSKSEDEKADEGWQKFKKNTGDAFKGKDKPNPFHAESKEKVGVEKNNWNKEQAAAYADGASNEEIKELSRTKTFDNKLNIQPKEEANFTYFEMNQPRKAIGKFLGLDENDSYIFKVGKETFYIEEKHVEKKK